MTLHPRLALRRPAPPDLPPPPLFCNDSRVTGFWRASPARNKSPTALPAIRFLPRPCSPAPHPRTRSSGVDAPPPFPPFPYTAGLQVDPPGGGDAIGSHLALISPPPPLLRQSIPRPRCYERRGVGGGIRGGCHKSITTIGATDSPRARGGCGVCLNTAL